MRRHPPGKPRLRGGSLPPRRYPRNLRTALLARIYLALRRDPALAVQLIDAQKEQLTNWLGREQDRIYADDLVALIHRFRAAQVEAAVVALDELRRLALVRAEVSVPSATPASTV